MSLSSRLFERAQYFNHILRERAAATRIKTHRDQRSRRVPLNFY